MRDATDGYDAFILRNAAALAVGGLIGLKVAGSRRSGSSRAVPAQA